MPASRGRPRRRDLGSAALGAAVAQARPDGATSISMAQPEARKAVEQVEASEVTGGAPGGFAAVNRGRTERWAPAIRAAGLRAG